MVTFEPDAFVRTFLKKDSEKMTDEAIEGGWLIVVEVMLLNLMVVTQISIDWIASHVCLSSVTNWCFVRRLMLATKCA